MPTYLYCLLPTTADGTRCGVQGIAGADVRFITTAEGVDAIEAWVSSVDDTVFHGADRQAVVGLALDHDSVVDAALSTGRTPAPVRFGQRFRDDAACIADIATRGSQLRALLKRIAGCVEMSVHLAAESTSTRVSNEARAVSARPQRGDSHAGRRYLESLRARERIAADDRATVEREFQRVRAHLGTLPRLTSTIRQSEGGWSMSHLIPRELVSDYRAALASVLPSPHFRLVVAGPRAPYSFVDDAEIERIGHESGSLISSD